MPKSRYQQARDVTLIGAFLNALQGIFKVIGGIYFSSHALIADGLHSFSDLLTDGLVMIASHFGSQDADETHPYGHHRIETAATLLLSLFLILVALGIMWHAFDALQGATLELPTQGALWMALLSILINELSFYLTLHIGKKINSPLLQTNAWHRRSDSASSLVVTVGIVGGLYGYAYLDAVAAIVVGLLIIKMGMDYSWNSIKELIDTSVPPDLMHAITSAITSLPGVNKIHQLRTRSMGHHILVDVHVLVFPYLSVSEGHYIAQHVHQALTQTFPAIADVTVHIDPEDNGIEPRFSELPTRQWIEQNLLLPLQHTYPDIQTWVLHYLNGCLTIDLYLKFIPSNLSQLQDTCYQLCQNEPHLKLIRLFHVIA